MKQPVLLFAFACTALAQDTISIGAPIFLGSGLNDATSGGHYTSAPANGQYTVRISATGTPDRFKWAKNGGALSADVVITGADQALSDGVTIRFAATSGHTLNDVWTVMVQASGDALQRSIQPGIGAIFRSQQDVNRDRISVKDYGAKGDGNTDDTAKIGKAMAAACSATPSKVFFPPGTYVVRLPEPSFKPIIPVCSNLEVEGPGTVKIANGAGAFYEMFGTAGADLTNFHLHHITVDLNSGNNPIADLKEIVTYSRIVVHGRGVGAKGNNVTVDHVHVANARSVWVFYFAGSNAQATNNLIDNFGGGSIATDTSLIYTSDQATNALISGNQILATARNAPMARTAMEIHSTAVITGNKITDMVAGMNLVGASVSTVSGMTVTGNTISGAYNCIQLWSAGNLGATSYGIRNVTVTGNTCEIAPRSYLAEGGAMSGIFLNPLANLPYGNIRISNNLVFFDLSNNAADPFNSASIGVGYWDATGKNSCDNCDFSGNTVINAPAAAIRFAANGSNLGFDNEMVINPGSSPNPGLIANFRTGLSIGGTSPFTGFVSIKGGTYIDNLPISRWGNGIAVPAGPIIIDGVTITCTDVVCASLSIGALYLGGPATTSVRAAISAPASALLPAKAGTPQSSIYDLRRAINYISDGKSWSYIHQHLASPYIAAPGDCGANPVIDPGSTDRSFQVKVGTGAVTSCKVTFGTAFTSAPFGNVGIAINSGSAVVTGFPATPAFVEITGTRMENSTLTYNTNSQN